MHKKFMLLGLLGLMFSQGFTVQNDNVIQICAYALKSGDSSSSGSSGGDYGHAWLSVKNISSNTQKIWAYELKSGEGLTISSWGDKKAHSGVWLNLEQKYPSTKHIATKDMNLGGDQLKEMNDYVKDHDYWDIWHDCANFTSDIWNLFASKDDQIKAGWIGTPDSLYKSIESKIPHYIGKSYPHNPDIGYIAGDEFIPKDPQFLTEMEVVRV